MAVGAASHLARRITPLEQVLKNVGRLFDRNSLQRFLPLAWSTRAVRALDRAVFATFDQMRLAHEIVKGRVVFAEILGDHGEFVEVYSVLSSSSLKSAEFVSGVLCKALIVVGRLKIHAG